MTTPIYLTQQEITDITGYQKRSCQVAWLRDNGFTVKIRADGSPLIARANYLRVMGADPQEHKSTDQEPDFSSLQNAS